MCEPDRGVPLGGVAAVAGIVAGGLVALRVLAAVAPFLVAVGAVTVALGAVSVPVLRWARRFSVVCLPARQPQAVVRQTALPAGTRLMLEPAKTVVVTPDMILQNAVKKETR